MIHNIWKTLSSNNAATELIGKEIAYFAQNFGAQEVINSDTPEPW
jgi:hypothetical protein